MCLLGLWINSRASIAGGGGHPRTSLYLEGLRGVAALCVVFHHLIWAFHPEWMTANYGPWYWLISGKFEVMLFFVLSGMVLGIQPLKTQDPWACIKGFSKRYIRLMWPILATSLITFALLVSHNFYNLALADINHAWWLGLFYHFKPEWMPFLSNTLLKVTSLGWNDYNNVLWSMKAEFWGSLFIYGLLGFHLVLKIPFRLIIIIPALLGFVAGLMGIEIGLHVMCFIMGLSILPLVQRYHTRLNARWAPAFIVMGLLLGSAPFYIEAINQAINATLTHYFSHTFLKALDARTVNTILLCASSYLLMLGIASSRGMQRLFEVPIIIWLGRISFSLYLVHCIVLLSLGCWTVLTLQPVLGLTGAYIVATVVTIVVSLASADLLTTLVDQPSVILSNYWGNWVVTQLKLVSHVLKAPRISKVMPSSKTRTDSHVRPIAIINQAKELELNRL